MTAPVRVLLLAPPGQPAAGAMPRGVQLHRCVDLADVLGRVSAGAADAVVLWPSVAGLDAAVVTRIRTLGCRVLALTARESDVERAARIGLGNWIAAPLDGKALLAALMDAPSAAAMRAGSARTSPVIAVWGPPGSPGRTTITALLAVGAARCGRSVAVVDADLAAPQWSMLAPSSGPGLLAATRRVGAGTPEVDSLLVDAAPGIRVLGASPEPERWTEASPLMVRHVLDAVSACSDVVLVDIGADIRAAHPAYDIGWAHDAAALSRTVLAETDALVAVLACDPVGVQRFASWWPLVRVAGPPDLVVANKVGQARAGRNPKGQVESVLQLLACAAPRRFVAWEQKAADDLLGRDWAKARGWGDSPAQLWEALHAVAPKDRAA